MSGKQIRRQCSTCEKSFANSRTLSHHKLSDHTKNPRRYLCIICSKSYASKGSLVLHVKLIHNKTENRFQCPTCPYRTKSNNALQGHLPDMRPFKCIQCTSTFKTKATLSWHHKRRHIPDLVSRTEECKFCGICFKSVTEMRRHARRKHGGKKLFVCHFDGCNRMFYASSELTSHTLQIHSDERPFRCAICLKAFKLKAGYEKHHSLVHVTHQDLRPFECKKCDVKFKVRTHLDSHIRAKHVAESVTRTEECPLCGKCFKTSRALLLHTNRIHLRQKPWSCSEGDCDKTFCSNSELMVHKHNRHSDIRRFQCAVCLAAFKRRGSFNTHYAAVHSKGK